MTEIQEKKESDSACSPLNMIYKDFFAHHDIWSDLDMESFSQISASFYSMKQYVNKIPYLVHHVWLTHTSNPREILARDIENVIKIKDIFGNYPSKWSHIIWTNDRDLIPISVEILEKNGIEVKSIKDYKHELRLFTEVMDLVEQKLYGMASDALRYNVVEKFGGIYSDLNFEFLRSIEEDLYKYDFIAQCCMNSFFAAKPNHPIIKHVTDIVEGHFNAPPTYLTSIDNLDEDRIFVKTSYFSLYPFSVAILKSSHQEANLDMILGKDKFYCAANEEGNSLEEEDYQEDTIEESECSYKELPDFLTPSSALFMIGKDGIETGFTWLEE